MNLLIVAAVGYLIGSVPFAYIIGKIFYRTDVREHGSGNLGGSNTGRVLGKKAGIAVMTLDLLKVTLAVFLALKISHHPWNMACGALSAAIGHCYPIYVRFRGGKAVAALYGFLFGLWTIADFSPWIFFLPLIIFLLVLAVFKIVSLSSILSSFAAVIYICAIDADLSIICAATIFFVLIVLRHIGNIQRMMAGTEHKIRWMSASFLKNP